MARYTHIDTNPRFLPVDLARQLLPGTFEHARELMALHTTHWPEWKGECESRQLVEL